MLNLSSLFGCSGYVIEVSGKHRQFQESFAGQSTSNASSSISLQKNMSIVEMLRTRWGLSEKFQDSAIVFVNDDHLIVTGSFESKVWFLFRLHENCNVTRVDASGDSSTFVGKKTIKTERGYEFVWILVPLEKRLSSLEMDCVKFIGTLGTKDARNPRSSKRWQRTFCCVPHGSWNSSLVEFRKTGHAIHCQAFDAVPD